MHDNSDHLIKSDQAHVLHPFSNTRAMEEGRETPHIMTGGQGIWIRDIDGRDLMDGLSGLYCMNVGYGREEIADALYEQTRQLAYSRIYYGQSHEPVIRLSERLCAMAPGDMKRVFYGTSGSDANETNIKLAWYYHNVRGKPEKKKLIARQRSYHGATVMTTGLTGLPVYHGLFDQPYGPVHHTGAPHYYWGAYDGESERDFSKRRARELEELILEQGPDTIAAFFGEPVLGSGGLVPPPEGYWEEIQAVLRKYDILLIADEVVTGFGRTGEMFGSARYKIQPDIIAVAKALTSAYVPFSASLIGERVNEAIKDGSDEMGLFTHGYTYTGHPLGAVAGLTTLDIVEREDLPGKAHTNGAYLFDRLRTQLQDHPLVGEVRGVGLMGAVEFVADRGSRTPFPGDVKAAKRITRKAFENGLIVRPMPNSDAVGLAPPLVITQSEADDLCDRLVNAVTAVTDELAREGHVSAA